MGNTTPTYQFQVGQFVDSRYGGSQEYYQGKIVKKHDDYRYDVKFLQSASIRTVFWDDIKPPSYKPNQQLRKQSTPSINKNYTSEINEPSSQKPLIKYHKPNVSQSNSKIIPTPPKKPITFCLNLDSFEPIDSDDNNLTEINDFDDNFNSNHNSKEPLFEFGNSEKDVEKRRQKEDLKWNEFLNNFHDTMNKHGTLTLNIGDKTNSDNKVDARMISRIDELLVKAGGNKFKDSVFEYHKNNANNKLKEIFECNNSNNSNNKLKDYDYCGKLLEFDVLDENDSKNDDNDNNDNNNDTIEITNLTDNKNVHKNENKPNPITNKSGLKNESSLINNKNNLSFRLRMDLNYTKTVTNNENLFIKNMKNEISNILNIDESLIIIDNHKAGSVIVTIIIIGGVLALFLAGIVWIGKKIKFKIDMNRINRLSNNNIAETNQDSQITQNTKLTKGEKFICDIGDLLQVSYKGTLYDCTVILVEHKLHEISQIKVKYNGKPFQFINTETLDINSPRIQAYIDPGIPEMDDRTEIYGYAKFGTTNEIEGNNETDNQIETYNTLEFRFSLFEEDQPGAVLISET